jgi:hypothetical protein
LTPDVQQINALTGGDWPWPQQILLLHVPMQLQVASPTHQKQGQCSHTQWPKAYQQHVVFFIKACCEVQDMTASCCSCSTEHLAMHI